MEIPFLMLILVFEPNVVRLFWKNPIFGADFSSFVIYSCSTKNSPLSNI